mgnify:CR=1 FL=1
MLSTNFIRNIKQQMLNIKAKYVKKKYSFFHQIQFTWYGNSTQSPLRDL